MFLEAADHVGFLAGVREPALFEEVLELGVLELGVVVGHCCGCCWCGLMGFERACGSEVALVVLVCGFERGGRYTCSIWMEVIC